MRKFALLIAYDGTAYCGWQRQDGSATGGVPSIQFTVETAVRQMTGEAVSVVASGRTDAGVHAAGQVAHLRLERKEWEPAVLARGLNAHLPADVRVLRAQAVAEDFHAQRSASRKQYSYYYQTGPCAWPPSARHATWLPKEVDVRAMSAAAALLVGKRDFGIFRAAGAKPGSSVREIFEAEVTAQPLPFPGDFVAGEFSGLIRIRLVGSGFLKQMVRAVAGTLLEVGQGKKPPEWMGELLSEGRREDIGATAPAQGLWLERVWYPPGFGADLGGMFT